MKHSLIATVLVLIAGCANLADNPTQPLSAETPLQSDGPPETSDLLTTFSAP